MKTRRSIPIERLTSALLWVAAFSFACGIYFAASIVLRELPPTAPVAVGRVTIERASKARDYAAALLFLAAVPLLTLWLRSLFGRRDERLRRTVARGKAGESGFLVSALAAAPFLLSPLFHLTTNKAGWVLLLPLALSFLLPRALHLVRSTHWLRAMLGPAHGTANLLVCLHAASWLVFRYIATERRIAHIPTLLLEGVFFLFFVVLFWASFALIARLATLLFGEDGSEAHLRVAQAGLPFALLPLMAIAHWPPARALAVVLLLFAILLPLALRSRHQPDEKRLRGVATLFFIPVLLYCVSYASTASHAQWLDLFHRGESLGPASDYLRGRAPYREVFVLHGLLEDGMLDAWLMEVFGRRAEVATIRPVLLGSFLPPALWFLGLAVFRSAPLALLTVMLGAWTTTENGRTLFEVVVVALLLHAIFRGKRRVALLAGVVAGVVLFVSYEIGVYSIAGGVLSIVALMLLRHFRRNPLEAPLGRLLLTFLIGVAGGATPFLIFLAKHGSVGAFLETSLVTIPAIIDAVWALPFPNLVETFRRDLNLHVIAEFVLREKFHMILNFLVIAIAAIYLGFRIRARRIDRLDIALLVLTLFAAITQRTALGRAEFRHQYFSAFLIAPMIVLLTLLLWRRVRALWREGDDGTRAFLTAATAAGIVAFAVLFWVPDLLNARMDDVLRYGRRSRGLTREPSAAAVEYRIQEVSREIRRLTRPGEPIFDFSNQPAFYFFADRPNATRFYQVPILSPPRFQRETLRALEARRPKVILRRSPELYDQFDGVPNDVRAQAVATYIDEMYQFHRTIRGVEIWRRKPAAYAASIDSYLAKIYLPSASDVATAAGRMRLLFPSIGSLPGANNSLWRSDLVLHNPHARRIDVSLRYVAGDVRIDRRVTLASGHSVRWEDVVRSLFRGPDSRGVLWIEYRGEFGPMARVQTYDASRAGRGTVETPLTVRDAASGNSDHDDLTILGLPGAGGISRRINVGAVNVGEIPATFRISVKTRRGRETGIPFEIGLPEDELFVLSDVERQLRTTIDESVTVHVRVIAGTCVAFATIVEEDGDNQLIPAVPSPSLR